MMTRQEFIADLRRELRKLPPEEIVAATEYYEEYFDDVLENLDTEGLSDEEIAGRRAKAEAELINELGNPKTLARQIRADYAARILEGDETATQGKATAGHKISAVWWVIIGIISAPVSIPVACGLACMLAGILMGIFGLCIGLLAGLVGGIALAVLGIVAMPTALSTGVMFFGAGLAAAAFCAAAIVGLFLLFRALLKALAGAVSRMREKRKTKKLETSYGEVR